MITRIVALLLVAAFCGLLYVIGSVPVGYWQAQHGLMAHPETGYPDGVKP